VEPPPVWRAPLDRLQPPARLSGRWLLVAITAGGAALVAGTWLVAELSLQGRLRALEAEVSLLRGTRQLDVPRLLNDLQRLSGPAADRLDLQDLKQRQAALERDHKAALEELKALRRSRRLEDRFSLSAGGDKELLQGKVPLLLERLEGDGAYVSLAGAPATLWRVNDFRDLNFGGGRFRLTLESLSSAQDRPAVFRLDALLEREPLLPPATAAPGPRGPSTP
jgi:hypothetical protein